MCGANPRDLTDIEEEESLTGTRHRTFIPSVREDLLVYRPQQPSTMTVVPSHGNHGVAPGPHMAIGIILGPVSLSRHLVPPG